MAQYTITEEQIKELAKWKHGKRLTQEWFPEVFENKLEVGKWYLVDGNKCGNRGAYMIANFSGTEKDNNYGFNFLGLWDTKISLYHNYLGSDTRLASESEVFKALKKEAKKRGFYDIGILTIKTIGNIIVNNFQTSGNDYFWNKYTNTLFLDGVTIFSNGKWASIIKEKTLSKSEAEAKLTELCKDGFEYKIELNEKVDDSAAKY